MAKRSADDRRRAAGTPVPGPPNFDPILAALRRSSRIYYAVAVGALILGVVVIAAGLLALLGDGTKEIVATGGTLVSGASILPFNLAAFRTERIGFLSTLHDHWSEAARAGDPNQEIPRLQDVYFALLKNRLEAAEPTGGSQ